MLSGAEQRLAKELPPDLVARFKFLTFAKDTEKTDDGNVVPGIGGEIYERLGLGDETEKNRIMPRLVRTNLRCHPMRPGRECAGQGPDIFRSVR